MAQAPDQSNPSVRVVLVDDDPLSRRAVHALIETMDGIEVVGEAAGLEEAMERVRSCSPDVVLMDIHLAGLDGLLATRALLQQDAGVRVLVLSVFPEDPFALESLRAGALGYLRKEQAPAHLEEAIRRVARGETYLSPSVAPALLQKVVRSKAPVAGRPCLTAREREVLVLLTRGLSNKEIAAALHTTTRTVKAHISRILEKLNVEDRTQAALLAVRLGLVDEGPQAPGLQAGDRAG